MKFTAMVFCSRATEQTGQPGKPNRIVALESVNPKDSVDNGQVFDGPGKISIEMTQLAKEAADGFDGGASYRLTIETIPNPAQAQAAQP